MINNEQPPFTIVELGAKFGSQMAANIAELITLEKVVDQQRQQIQDLSNRENSLVDSIQDLEMELDQWKADFVELEAEMEKLKRATSNTAGLSSDLAETAAAAKAIIDGK